MIRRAQQVCKYLPGAPATDRMDIQVNASESVGLDRKATSRQVAAQRNMDSTQRPQNQITAFCQACGSKLSFDARAVGRKAKCLSCGHVFTVPDTRRSDPTTGPKETEAREKPNKRAPEPPGHEPQLSQPNDGVKFDPLDALASSERTAKGEPAEQEIPAEQAQPEEIEVISNPAIDPQATVTALGVMLGLLYLALITIGIILLHWKLRPVLTVWILLPLAIVYGRKTAIRIIYLLAGKTIAAGDPAG